MDSTSFLTSQAKEEKRSTSRDNFTSRVENNALNFNNENLLIVNQDGGETLDYSKEPSFGR
jgi:hypothetical protein